MLTWMTFLWLLKELFCSKFLLTLLWNFKLLFVKISLSLTDVNIGFVLFKHFSSICFFFFKLPETITRCHMFLTCRFIRLYCRLYFNTFYLCIYLFWLDWLIYNWLTQKHRNGWVTSKRQKTLRIIALAITSWLRVENRTQYADH